MATKRHPIFELLQRDPRYTLEAYQFVREALAFAQQELVRDQESATAGESPRTEEGPHLTGQQLCEAIRRYATEQYGLLAKTVLNSWGVHTTGDFGEIVYNLISINVMKKSASDRREDFDNLYDFAEVFHDRFQIVMPE